MNKIYVIGSQNVDHTFRMKDLPMRGETVLADTYEMGTGGKGANQAIAAACFGGNVEMIGCVGDDSAAKALLDTLTEHGVGTRYVQRTHGASGLAVVYVDHLGANCIAVHPGANRRVSRQTIPTFDPGDLVLAQMEVNTDAVAACFAAAKQAGATTVLNPSPYHLDAEDLIALTDLLVLNQHEAFEATGVAAQNWETGLACISALLRMGAKNVVLTLGSKGVMCRGEEDTFAIDGLPVEIVDTQGAGDAFLGAFASKLGAGGSLREAASFANRVGAYAVTRSGSTQVSLPALDEPF